jgi:predicted pyridoxine 5'-phosphate oxidase superfamily flavin-nucleotide-binding protein
MYHEGQRSLQDRFDSRRIADRLVEVLHRTGFSGEDRVFIESRAFFFLATADAAGRPDCSYKGGQPGFVRVVGPGELAFPATTATACSAASETSWSTRPWDCCSSTSRPRGGCA